MDPAESLLNFQGEAHDAADLVAHRSAEDPRHHGVVEQIPVGGLTTTGHAETGVNLPREHSWGGWQQPILCPRRHAERVRTSADVESLAASVESDVGRNVGDTGDHVEAVIEGEGEAGAHDDADLLLEVKHPILSRDPSRPEQPGVGTQTYFLPLKFGAPTEAEGWQTKENGGPQGDGQP